MSAIEYIAAFLMVAMLLTLVPRPAARCAAGWEKLTASADGTLRTAGIAASYLAVSALAGLGFTVLAEQWPTLSQAVQTVGGLAILYLGLEMLNSPAGAETEGRHRISATALLLCGVFIVYA